MSNPMMLKVKDEGYLTLNIVDDDDKPIGTFRFDVWQLQCQLIAVRSVRGEEETQPQVAARLLRDRQAYQEVLTSIGMPALSHCVIDTIVNEVDRMAEVLQKKGVPAPPITGSPS